MDDVTGIQTVQPLALCQIPQHGNTILQPSCIIQQHCTARSAEAAGSVRFAKAVMVTDGEVHLQEPMLVHRVRRLQQTPPATT